MQGLTEIVYQPVTVISNEHVPSFDEVSLALHVTVVVPTEKESPDDTALPEVSVHLITEVGPSTTSSADGIGDQSLIKFISIFQ